jgi:dTDP-glucose pyrophosphorylase
MNNLVARDIGPMCVGPADSLRQAMACIDRGRSGIALVTDAAGRLLGTITDGDTRRAILAQQDLNAPLESFLHAKMAALQVQPVTAPAGTDPATLLALMGSQGVRQIPLLDRDECVTGLAVIDDLLPIAAPALRAVIMAGGLGTRLLPLTQDLPKPMLPIGGRPLMEHIIEHLRQAGIRHVKISTHYKADSITGHFGDGKAFGVDLQYANEDEPLGTGGALGLMSPPDETQLVINGDILTQVDLRAMLAFHQENAAEMTVAVQRYEMQVPYGVIECEGARITSVKEKPQVPFLVNAGMYLLEPSVYQFIPNGQSFNMTDLIRWLLDAGRRIIGFPIREYWMDVGQLHDYAQAQADMQNGRVAP